MESNALPSSWAWSVFILPFIDQAPLYASLTAGSAPPAPAAQIAASGDRDVTLPGYLCPSDPGSNVVAGKLSPGLISCKGKVLEAPDAKHAHPLGVGAV